MGTSKNRGRKIRFSQVALNDMAYVLEAALERLGITIYEAGTYYSIFDKEGEWTEVKKRVDD